VTGETYETLKLTRVGEHVLLVTLSRPEASNAMNTQLSRDVTARRCLRSWRLIPAMFDVSL